MTTAMTTIDRAISEYKALASRVKALETKKDELKAAIRTELGTEEKYVGPRGSAIRVNFMQRKTNFDLAKKLLDADVYYEIVSETPVEQLRVS